MVAALRYDESEGPTKVDYGENDDSAALPEADIKNGEKASGWKNPLARSDDGEDDDSVLLATRNEMSAGQRMLINLAAPKHKKDRWDIDDLDNVSETEDQDPKKMPIYGSFLQTDAEVN